MGITNPDLTESKFPDEIDEFMRMTDLEVGDKPLVAQYYTLMDAGNYADAVIFLAQNPQLGAKIFNAAKFNRLSDSILAVQRFFRDGVQGFFDGLHAQASELSFRGDWGAGLQYVTNNIVNHLHCGYIAIQENKGHEPPTEASDEYWGLISRGIPGESGTGMTPRYSWIVDTTYYPNDIVWFNNALWAAASQNINSDPADGNPDWIRVLNSIPPKGFLYGDLQGNYPINEV